MDDAVLIPEYDENDNLVLHYKENKLIKNLRAKISSKIVWRDSMISFVIHIRLIVLALFFRKLM